MSRQFSTDRPPTGLEGRDPEAGTPPRRIGVHTGRSRRVRASSLAEAMKHYTEARDAWVAAMRAANSGRPADMASLALAQEEYELAVVERDRWRGSGAVAIPVEPEEHSPIDAIVGQELAWRDVHHEEQERQRRSPGLLGRVFGRRRRS